MEKQENFITKEDDIKNNIVGGVAVDRLRSLIERIEKLTEEKKEYTERYYWNLCGSKKRRFWCKSYAHGFEIA